MSNQIDRTDLDMDEAKSIVIAAVKSTFSVCDTEVDGSVDIIRLADDECLSLGGGDASQFWTDYRLALETWVVDDDGTESDPELADADIPKDFNDAFESLLRDERREAAAYYPE